MRVYFDKPLRHRKKEGWVKLFDLVSEDFGIVGDVRCFSMYRRPEMPPNAGAMISEEVWMLEKTGAKTVFGLWKG